MTGDLLLTVYVVLFAACGITDFLWMRIPNVVVASLLALFVVAAIRTATIGTAGIDPVIWWALRIVPAAAVFALACIPFHFNKLGGGDVKLLTVTALWAGAEQIGNLLFFLGIGGIFLFAVFKCAARPLEWGVMRCGIAIGRRVFVPRSLSAEGHLPYGIVIAAAALLVAERLPFW